MISAWEKYKTIVYPNDVNAKKRQTTYTVVCLDCETPRTICYAQAWNIVKSIEMDHIKEWCNYPELRFDINNCRTLCSLCHKQTDNYSYKALKKKKEIQYGT
jgi:5-methylcytosine-specific restriction endonuclease McrA